MIERRAEASKWVERPGMTNLFVRYVEKTPPRQIPYRPDADYNWLKNESGIGFIPLQIELPLEVMRRETAAAVPHMGELAVGSNDSKGWTNFGMFSKSVHDPYEFGHENRFMEADWVGLANELMPETVRWFREQWPHDRFWRMRLLGLAPGGVIGLHNDITPGLKNINIAIHHPPECRFFVEHWGEMKFKPGSVYAFDVSYNHAVINPSDQLRLHITIYQDDDQRFKDLLVKSYHAMHKEIE